MTAKQSLRRGHRVAKVSLRRGQWEAQTWVRQTRHDDGGVAPRCVSVVTGVKVRSVGSARQYVYKPEPMLREFDVTVLS